MRRARRRRGRHDPAAVACSRAARIAVAPSSTAGDVPEGASRTCRRAYNGRYDDGAGLAHSWASVDSGRDDLRTHVERGAIGVTMVMRWGTISASQRRRGPSKKGIDTVVVGRALGFWTDNMPEGMYLRIRRAN